MKIHDDLKIAGDVQDMAFDPDETAGSGFGVHTDENGKRTLTVDRVVARDGVYMHPRYELAKDEETEDASIGDATSAIRMRLRVLNGRMYLDSTHNLDNADVRLGRVGRSTKRYLDKQTGKIISKKTNGWRITGPLSEKIIKVPRADYFLGLSLRRNLNPTDPATHKRYSFRYQVWLHSENHDAILTSYGLTSCFGYIDDSGSWVVRNGHSTAILLPGSSAKQTYAVVINGFFLPFITTQSSDSEKTTFGMAPV